MLKKTQVFYPHIVKQYESVNDFITENGYDEYYAMKKQNLVDNGIDHTDSTRYQEAITADGFEASVTVTYDDEAQYQAVIAGTYEADKLPIFEEDSTDHLF